ncbi:aldehyde dehydrogenase family protein [Actinocorallia sp. API 0066]|uniref:aldehyde dehydrogenase family protein n=1 Tax=Actinocorallia sp. API 0066 TaxID=2896846 RepID=UPI001E2AE49A|nr:aldehyde dehydrogenase family protein [Actinocorallia sp. API 0066]MCD0447707.1 aldehyde dehydrogenase family protein [Actinocorallia sp. API 0066]
MPKADKKNKKPKRTEGGPVRLSVRKTYKLFIGGAFPRSESGRSYVVHDADGAFLANASLASRKDVRDAVVAARKAFGPWAARTAYNRGQILYRIAEMLEGRRAQFVAELRATGRSAEAAGAEVDAAVDRWVWYAGWADKVAAVAGNPNAVAGPFLNISTPVPTGVVGVLAPEGSPLLGLASVLAPAIATGNTAVAVADSPLVAVTFAEVLATSDLPGGVVNILTGHRAELAPWLAGHMDVNALDLAGASAELAAECERAAASNLKRVLRPADEDWHADPGLRRLTAFLETRTVWHPVGV